MPSDPDKVGALVTSNTAIHTAELDHIPQIVEIAQHFTTEGIPSAEAVERGFLVSRFTADDYRDLLQRAEHAYVASVAGEVVGFVIAYSSDQIQDDEWLNSMIKARHSDPFVIIKQVAVRSGHLSRGIASALYAHLMRTVTGVPFFAAVVLDPPNRKSIALHEKHGFRMEFDVTPPDGLPRGVFRRHPTK